MRTYAHIGTGNYHPKTAQLYTDLGLLTAHQDLCERRRAPLQQLTGHAGESGLRPPARRAQEHALRFCALIDARSATPKDGPPRADRREDEPARRPVLTDKLYEADAGVPIDLIVRGFCCLRAGVPGLSENIRVTSVVGRFLEHSRIVHFAAGRDRPEDGLFFFGSADWMYRNLSDRVEAHTPVLDPTIRAELWAILDTLLRDRFNAWDLGPDGVFTRRTPVPAGDGSTRPEAVGTFETLMARARGRDLDAHVGALLSDGSTPRSEGG
jgi:polyphosphate kinase